MRTLHIGATGMLAQQLMVETTANNIANVNTNGFKKSRAVFQDLFYQNFREVGTLSSERGTIVPVGVQVGLGVKTSGVYRVHGTGSLTGTDNPLDLSVNGRGFFRIGLPDGQVGYTRSGTFQLSGEGELVTVDGYRVLPSITVPSDATQITVNQNGQVQVSLDGQIDPQTVGQLQLAVFVNEGGLEARGDNLFLETPASGQAINGNPGDDGFGTILQGFLESSNVEAVEEITTMISAQRAYEMNSKVIETADQMAATVTNVR